MVDGLRLLVRQPVLGQTAAERDKLLAIIETAIASGKTVVLGGERCFFCGALLGAPVPDEVKRTGSGPVKLFLRLCDDCYKAVNK